MAGGSEIKVVWSLQGIQGWTDSHNLNDEIKSGDVASAVPSGYFELGE